MKSSPQLYSGLGFLPSLIFDSSKFLLNITIIWHLTKTLQHWLCWGHAREGALLTMA